MNKFLTRLLASKEHLLDKPTLNPVQLAKLHGVPLEQIEQQLAKGIKIEQEHTSDLNIAREIALDHLREFLDYYSRLERAEQ